MAEETTQPTPPEEESAPAAAPAPRRPRQASPLRRYTRARRAKVCQFCVEKVDYIDYKKHELLLPYISPYGKMLSRRRTGVCAKHQRRLAKAIKRARFLALLPYTAEHIRRYGS
ncbi:MAG TPA: 30S ribosomal protein S18 [Caldilineales bacterium]|nr:30S ribosomal protein S18 [Caldilineales bacterium]